MIAVALGLLSLVVMIATGVAASSTDGDHLMFLGVGVQTTTAQVFLTGAIFGWVFVIALWLLRFGMQRSGQRCAQLAARRSRSASEWLGFGESGADGDGWRRHDDGSPVRRRSRSDACGAETRGVRFRVAAAVDAEGTPSYRCGQGGVHRRQPKGVRLRRSAPPKPEGAVRDGIVGRAGATRHRRGTPGGADRGGDKADRAVAGTPDQPGPLSGGHAPRPAAGRLRAVGAVGAVGVDGMDGGAQRRQVGGGSGPVSSQDRGAEGEYHAGEGRQ